MKNTNNLSYMVAITITLLFSIRLTAQVENGRKNLFYGDNGKISFAEFEPNTANTIENATTFLLTELGASTDYSLIKVKEEVDGIGIKHCRFNFLYKGIRVDNTDYLVHSRNGLIETINGSFQIINLSNVVATLSESQSLTNALANVNATEYAWQNESLETALKQQKNDINATYFPKGELVITNSTLNKDSFNVLAWKFTIVATNPFINQQVYVNALDGSIVKKHSNICDGNATGTAETWYSGTRSITTDNLPTGGYRLYETRGTNNVVISTKNAHNTWVPSNLTEFVDNNNNWTATEWNPNFDRIGLDAHWACEKIVDYWQQQGRNSIDGLGKQVNTYVHYRPTSIITTIPWPNSQWIGGTGINYLGLGDGDGVNLEPFTSLDIIAHEFGHGVCEYTSNLYNDFGFESGALNEGLSDIWGAVIEHWVDPNKQTWLWGEEICYTAPHFLRDLQHPKNSRTPQPDYYGGQYWDGEQHNDAGVLTRWFYLLSQGGTGINEAGKSYSVNGIGIDLAAAIVYRTEQYFLNQLATYQDARNVSIISARQLNGGCIGSAQEIAVIKAWYAVGVGADWINPTITPVVSTICNNTPVTFTFNNVPINSYPVWTVTPTTGVVSSTGSGNTITLTKTGNGVITLMGTLTGFCGVFSQSISIQLGIPPAPVFYAVQHSAPNTPTVWSFSAPASPTNDIKYKWYRVVNGGIPTRIFPSDRIDPSNFDLSVPCGVTIAVFCTVTNACGTSVPSPMVSITGYCRPIKGVTTTYDQPIKLPHGNLRLAVATTSTEWFGHLFYDKASLATETIAAVNVYNKDGDMMKQVTGINTRQTDIDCSDLPVGTYIFEIFGRNTYSELHTVYLSQLDQDGYLMDDVASGNLTITGDRAADRLYVLQQKLYDDLQSDSAAMEQSETLRTFAADKANGSFGKIYQMEAALAIDDLATVDSTLKHWTPENAVDSNYQYYYMCYLKVSNNDSLSLEELRNLLTIAQGCPLTDGEIVYAARDLYSYLVDSTINFSNSCSSIGLRTTHNTPIANNQLQTPNNIYPNPSKGSITIDNLEYGTKTITVTNVYGKTVQQLSTRNKSAMLEIKTGAGMYFINITNIQTGKSLVKKVVVE